MAYRVNENLWRLYRNTETDKENYSEDRGLDKKIKIAHNPVPDIIDTDISLIGKNMKIRVKEGMEGIAEEITGNYNFLFNLTQLRKNMLIDGITWCEISLVTNGLYEKEDYLLITPIKLSQVRQIKYNYLNEIVEITFQIKRDNSTITKEYKINEQGLVELKYQDENGKTMTQQMMMKKIPIAEYIFYRTDDANNVSRISGVETLIDEINTHKSQLNSVFDIHAEPVAYGSASLTEDYDETEDNVREGQTIDLNRRFYKYISVPENSEMKFLEMQGNIARLLKEKINEEETSFSSSYPELLMNKLMGGGADSGYAVFLKLSGLDNIINKLRNAEENFISEMFDIACQLKALVYTGIVIKYADIVAYNNLDRANLIISLVTNALLDMKTGYKLVGEMLEESSEEIENNLQKEEYNFQKQNLEKKKDLSQTNIETKPTQI